MSAAYWYLTIKLYRFLRVVGLSEIAERWAEWSGLRQALEDALRSP